MNWITNYVRPTINSLFSRREVPENLWSKCPECGTMLFHRELSDNLNVCSNCDHHLALTPRERFAALVEKLLCCIQKAHAAVAEGWVLLHHVFRCICDKLLSTYCSLGSISN